MYVSVPVIIHLGFMLFMWIGWVLSPWNRVLFEKLIYTQLVKKSPPFIEPDGLLPCVHNSLPPVPFLSQMSAVHTLQPYFYFNILIFTTRISKWSLPFRLPNQIFIPISHVPHACYMPCSSHPPFLHHPNSVWWRVQIMELLITVFSTLLSFHSYVQIFS